MKDTDNDIKKGRQASSGRGTKELPKIDLPTFILSLSTSALYQMGVVEGPDGEKAEAPNRGLAQQTIDTLEMLAEKTRGNLESGEAKLLESILYELHMKFVEKRWASAPAQGVR